jgi:hypothetical protein
MANGTRKEIHDDWEHGRGGQPYPSFTIPLTIRPEDADADSEGPASDEPGAALGRVVTGTLRDVLGWNPNVNDPDGFTGALEQSFDLKAVEGHVESSWKKRSFAVYTDLEGGVTGAQASVYTRAKHAVDEALPLLDELYTLAVDSDPQEVDAIKAIIKQLLQELVGELGRMGGPRVPRVDQIFDILLGREETATNVALSEPHAAIQPLSVAAPGADDVAGEIGRLRRELKVALADGRAIDVKEENNQTKYRILADYVSDLRVAWKVNRRFFRLGTESPFFGTQLVHLQRLLAVIAGQVREVRFAFTSLFIGPNERQTLEVVPRWILPQGIIQFAQKRKVEPHSVVWLTPGVVELDELVENATPLWVIEVGEPIYLEDALSWIETFAREEGPQLIRSAGKLGVQRAFFPVASRLRRLVCGLRCPLEPEHLPAAYGTLRVKHSLFELETQFEALLRAAGGIHYETSPGYDEKGDEPRKGF